MKQETLSQDNKSQRESSLYLQVLNGENEQGRLAILETGATSFPTKMVMLGFAISGGNHTSVCDGTVAF